ncbi:UNVERIFIED_CONTAM: SAP30-binding protein [Gekko kuhli]
MAAARKSVLSSLAVYAEDSKPELDSKAGGAGSERGTGPEEKGGLVSEGYGEDDFSKMDGEEDGYDEDGDENSKQSDFSEVEKRDPQELVASFSERVRNMSPDEIKISPEPPGRCSNHLQDKIQKLYERKIKEGDDKSTTTTTTSTVAGDAQKRKSKWDSAIPVMAIAQPTILTTTATLPAVVTVTTRASGSKTTVISAVGTIVKKAKQ